MLILAVVHTFAMIEKAEMKQFEQLGLDGAGPGSADDLGASRNGQPRLSSALSSNVGSIKQSDFVG